MSTFVQNEFFEVEHCCSCGMAFAMTTDFQKRRLDDRKSFYCPAGHSQYYSGKTEAQKLRDKLKERDREVEAANRLAEQQRQAAYEQRQRAASISRSYQKVRERVRNGVCPCCNRTFENLARHMATKHADYGTHQQLRTLRLAYGLTQAQLAEEVGVSAPYVSLYERGMELPKSGLQKLDEWVSEQSATA